MKISEFVTILALSVCPFAAHAGPVEQAKSNPTTPLAAKAGFDWTGLYAGVNGGYTAGDFRDEEYGWYGMSANGGSFGGQIGYNLGLGQSNMIVGIEVEIDKDTVSGASNNWNIIYYKNNSVSLLGRLGVNAGNFMPYITAGNSSASVAGEPWSRWTPSAWTAGLGTEIALTDNLVGRVEYRYSDFGYDYSVGYDLHVIDSTLRLGLNYYFH